MRTAAKRDLTEPAIIAALERLGWTVYPLSGKALPDLLLNRGDVWRVCEVKSGVKRTRAGKGEFRKDRLTKAQQKAGITRKWPIVRSVEEAIGLFAAQNGRKAPQTAWAVGVEAVEQLERALGRPHAEWQVSHDGIIGLPWQGE